MAKPDIPRLMFNQLDADLRQDDLFLLKEVSVIPGEKRPDFVEAQIGAQQLSLDYSLETGLLRFNDSEFSWSMQDNFPFGNQSHLLIDVSAKLAKTFAPEFDEIRGFPFDLKGRAGIRNHQSYGRKIFWPFEKLEQSNIGRQLLKPRIADYVDLQHLPLTLQSREAIALVNYADNFQFRHAVVIRPTSKRKVVLSRHEHGVHYQGDCESILVSTLKSEHLRQVHLSSGGPRDDIATNKDSMPLVLGNINFDALQQWCPVTYVRGEDGAMKARD